MELGYLQVTYRMSWSTTASCNLRDLFFWLGIATAIIRCHQNVYEYHVEEVCHRQREDILLSIYTNRLYSRGGKEQYPVGVLVRTSK
jgi:hypothetical protein